MRYHPNGRHSDRQYALAYGARPPPVYASLPTNAVDAVLDGLDRLAIATALPVLAVAQGHAIKQHIVGEPVAVRISMSWLAGVTRLDIRTVVDALNELLHPLPYGWPAILDGLTTRQGEIMATVNYPFCRPRDHIRIPLPLPTESYGAVRLVIEIAESNRLSWPHDPATRLPFRPRERTVAIVNRFLRGADHDRLANYDIHLPRAIRRIEREMLHGPTRVLGTELMF